MSRFETFDRDIRVATEGLSQEAISAELARFARAELAAVVASGEGSPSYDRFVNGREGVSEDQVEAPGPILYRFSWWAEVIATALGELVKLSPRRSGRYAGSFVVIADGQVAHPGEAIGLGSEVIITNAQPYVRKVEQGHWVSTPPKMFENAGRRVRAAYSGMLLVQTMFLRIPAGIHPLIPYILRGAQRSASRRALAEWYQVPDAVIDAWRAQGRKLGTVNMLRRAAAQNRMSSAWRAGREFLSGRKDTAAGQPLTYPALVLNMVD